jgi:predicted nucleic acid-binding Zn ribbon protein
VSRRGRPQPLGETIRALRSETQPATLLAAVQACWRDALGAEIAAQAQPVREREGTITVECRAATWAQELDLLQDELVERLNVALSKPRVSRLRMVVGDNLSNDTL